MHTHAHTEEIHKKEKNQQAITQGMHDLDHTSFKGGKRTYKGTPNEQIIGLGTLRVIERERVREREDLRDPRSWEWWLGYFRGVP